MLGSSHINVPNRIRKCRNPKGIPTYGMSSKGTYWWELFSSSNLHAECRLTFWLKRCLSIDGAKVSSWIYFYRLTSGDVTQSKKMIMAK